MSPRCVLALLHSSPIVAALPRAHTGASHPGSATCQPLWPAAEPCCLSLVLTCRSSAASPATSHAASSSTAAPATAAAARCSSGRRRRLPGARCSRRASPTSSSRSMRQRRCSRPSGATLRPPSPAGSWRSCWRPGVSRSFLDQVRPCFCTAYAIACCAGVQARKLPCTCGEARKLAVSFTRVLPLAVQFCLETRSSARLRPARRHPARRHLRLPRRRPRHRRRRPRLPRHPRHCRRL